MQVRVRVREMHTNANENKDASKLTKLSDIPGEEDPGIKQHLDRMNKT